MRTRQDGRVHTKLPQSHLSLCDTMDYSLPGFSVPGILQADTGVGRHALLQGIFPTQGLNLHLLCLLPWQWGSLPLVPPGKPSRAQRAHWRNGPDATIIHLTTFNPHNSGHCVGCLGLKEPQGARDSHQVTSQRGPTPPYPEGGVPEGGRSSK